ncbi:MAG: hypothetical protein CME62_06505 [Halobacteriovoraceae bacterium]|nr:hypothetical protein [Halobacteriovoraceae bacterium]|tara:strand:+ start:17359 stop:17781 length:423 start_codon:yes stop_codon:yes gene_type:complete
MSERYPLLFRFIHWWVAFTVILNFFILEVGEVPHRYIGYIACLLVLIRVTLRTKRTISHYNPKAKYVYYLIWLGILFQGMTGFLMGTDTFWGSSTLEGMHELSAQIIVALASLHIGGVFLDAWRHKRRTWMLMISGVKEE